MFWSIRTRGQNTSTAGKVYANHHVEEQQLKAPYSGAWFGTRAVQRASTSKPIRQWVTEDESRGQRAHDIINRTMDADNVRRVKEPCV